MPVNIKNNNEFCLAVETTCSSGGGQWRLLSATGLCYTINEHCPLLRMTYEQTLVSLITIYDFSIVDCMIGVPVPTKRSTKILL